MITIVKGIIALKGIIDAAIEGFKLWKKHRLERKQRKLEEAVKASENAKTSEEIAKANRDFNNHINP